jgi:hypothetical protein
MDFRTLPQGGVTLANVTIPACLLGQEGDLIRTDISIADGLIAEPQAIAVDMGGAMVFPAFVDMHTHLDKGHIWPRSPNPDGTFMGALTTVRADSSATGAPRTCARAWSSRCAPPTPTARARSARISTASRRRTTSPGPSSGSFRQTGPTGSRCRPCA